MKLNFKNLELYPLTLIKPKQYHAFGTIDLYDENGKKSASVFFDVPKCYYDENTKELISITEVDE